MTGTCCCFKCFLISSLVSLCYCRSCKRVELHLRTFLCDVVMRGRKKNACQVGSLEEVGSGLMKWRGENVPHSDSRKWTYVIPCDC